MVEMIYVRRLDGDENKELWQIIGTFKSGNVIKQIEWHGSKSSLEVLYHYMSLTSTKRNSDCEWIKDNMAMYRSPPELLVETPVEMPAHTY